MGTLQTMQQEMAACRLAVHMLCAHPATTPHRQGDDEMDTSGSLGNRFAIQPWWKSV
jgi:hypothetical protein